MLPDTFWALLVATRQVYFQHFTCPTPFNRQALLNETVQAAEFHTEVMSNGRFLKLYSPKDQEIGLRLEIYQSALLTCTLL